MVEFVIIGGITILVGLISTSYVLQENITTENVYLQLRQQGIEIHASVLERLTRPVTNASLELERASLPEETLETVYDSLTEMIDILTYLFY